MDSRDLRVAGCIHEVIVAHMFIVHDNGLSHYEVSIGFGIINVVQFIVVLLKAGYRVVDVVMLRRTGS